MKQLRAKLVHESVGYLQGVIQIEHQSEIPQQIIEHLSSIITDEIMANMAADLLLVTSISEEECRWGATAMRKLGSYRHLISIRAILYFKSGQVWRCYADLRKAIRLRPDMWRQFDKRLGSLLPIFILPYLKNALADNASDTDRGFAAEFFLRVGMPELADHVLQIAAANDSKQLNLLKALRSVETGNPEGASVLINEAHPHAPRFSSKWVDWNAFKLSLETYSSSERDQSECVRQQSISAPPKFRRDVTFSLNLPPNLNPSRFLRIIEGLDLTGEAFFGTNPRLLPLACAYIPWVGGPARLSRHRARDFCVIDYLPRPKKADQQRKILLDCTWEGIRWENQENPLGFLHQLTVELDMIGIDPRCVTLMHLNESLCFGPDDARIVDEINGMRVLGRAFVIGLSGATYRRQRRQGGGMDTRLYAAKRNLTHVDTNRRHFLCYNHMSRPHRIMVAAKIGEIGAFEKTLLSFQPFSYSSHGVLKTRGWDDLLSAPLDEEVSLAIDSFKKARLSLSLLSDPKAALCELHKRLPMSVDVHVQDHADQGKALGFGLEYQEPYLQSYISIVTETNFSYGNQLMITEKILKTMYGLHPFILVGDPFSLRQLKRYGFETFSPFIDESYDEILIPSIRMEKVLAEIERLSRLSLADLHEMTNLLWPRLEHNYFHLMNNSPAIYRSFLEEAVA